MGTQTFHAHGRQEIGDEIKEKLENAGVFKFEKNCSILDSFFITRAPPILVLDEDTSSIDPYTELKIKEAQSILLKERTSLIIAHRLSTVVNADNIIVLDHGRIVEEGNHNKLIRKDGRYRRLCEMQFRDIKKPMHNRD